MFIKLKFKKNWNDCSQKYSDIRVNSEEILYYYQYADENTCVIVFKNNAPLRIGQTIDELEEKLKL